MKRRPTRNRSWEYVSARARCAGSASIWLASCAVAGPTSPEEFPGPPPAVAALTVTGPEGASLPDPVRLGLEVRLRICAQARDAAGEDVTSSLDWPGDVLRASLAADDSVARIDGIVHFIGQGLCVLVATGIRPGSAVLVFEHVRDGQVGATAQVTIETTGP